VTLPTKLPLAISLWLFASLAMAQSKLGELLDAGAKKLSAVEFKQELVGHLIVGPTPAGGSIEVMYTPSGAVQGKGSYQQAVWPASIDGEWTIDDEGRVCTSMRIGGAAGGGLGPVTLPPKCQPWFKLGAHYFLSDSDSDRQTRVLRRTVKQ